MSEKHLQFLHRNYSRTGRWGWRIARRVRSFGWGLAMVCTLSAVLGTNVETSGIYLIFCFSVCSLTTGLIWIFFRQSKVSAIRTLPEFGSVGQELTYTIEVRNNHRKKLSAMLFEEWPPDPTPDYQTFANTPEPGEQQRNIVDRTLLYYRWTWIQEQERGFNLLEATQSPRHLNPNQKAPVHFSLTPQTRGILHLSELRIILPDPFGLFQKCQLIQAPKDHLIVLPKQYPLNNLNLPGKAHLHLGGNAASNSIGQTGDFLHLREYRSGDAMRSVDWKSWARTGIPVVREYEDNFFPHYGVVLDNSGSPGPQFEEAVSIAASFVTSMSNQESLLDLLFIGEKSDRLTAGQGVAHKSKLLEALATVKAHKKNNLKTLKTLIQQESASLTALILIFPDWTTAQRDFHNQLLTEGIQATAFVIVNDQTKQNFISNPAPNVHLLHHNSIPQDLALATAQLQ